MRVRVILVRPEQARNVGTVVRAAANFGAESVHVVGASDWSSEDERQAHIASAGAWDVMGGVIINPTIKEASLDCAVLAGASARWRGDAGIPQAPREFVTANKAQDGVVGVLFGPESQGLTVEDLALCHVWLRIPTHVRFPSLNLAQAVLVVLCEAWQGTAPSVSDADTSMAECDLPASMPAQEGVLDKVTSMLAGSDGQMDAAVLGEIAQIRRFLHRANPTRGELAALANVFKRLKHTR